jgi:hypothetical protein
MHERGLVPPVPGPQPYERTPIPIAKYQPRPGTPTTWIRCSIRFTLLTDGIGETAIERVAFEPGVFSVPTSWLDHWYVKAAGCVVEE